jgi:cytochrome b561
MRTMRSRSAQFSWVAKSFHWLVAFLLLSLIPVAFSFAWTAPADRAGAIPVHASIGLLVLGLTLARHAYRAVVPPPALPPQTPTWMQRGARIGHHLLYALLYAQALLGLWLAALSPVGISFFNTLNLSALAPANPALAEVLRPWHFALACLFTVVLIGHGLAALWHHVVLRDDVLVRMLPFGGLWQRLTAAEYNRLWRFPSLSGKPWPKGRLPWSP